MEIGLNFDISPAAATTVVGSAVLSSLAALWLKHFFKDKWFVPLLVLVLALATSLLAAFIVNKFEPGAANLYSATLAGFIGATLAVFGYETITNALGRVGIGPRSPSAREYKAIRLLHKEGYQVDHS